MEKQRNKSISKLSRRLLNLLFIFTVFSTGLSAQTLRQSEISQLRIKPAEDQNLFTKNDLRFEVLLPKVKPSQVQIHSPVLPANVTFKTVRKQENFENGGTKIELWYSFDKKGTYQLPDLPVQINYQRRYIKFSPVTLSEDPSKQSPQMVVIFSNGTRVSSSDETKNKPFMNAKVGQKLKMTVYVQYISQVVQFSWDIPKDSIFTQTKTYDITEIRYREKNYTHDLIPVANFEWTGLKTGTMPMVKIKTVVTDYNGYRNELLLPMNLINFVEDSSSSQTNSSSLFDDAFFDLQNQNENETEKSITREDCIKLAELFSAERNSILHFSKNFRQRVDFETSIGLPATSKGDFTTGFLHISIITSIILLVFLLIFIKRKHFLLILFLSALFICSLVPLVNLSVKRNDTYAICAGCTIHSVPEEKSEAVSEIGAGNRVHITEQAGKWVYIEFGETGGWGLKDNIIFIK